MKHQTVIWPLGILIIALSTLFIVSNSLLFRERDHTDRLELANLVLKETNKALQENFLLLQEENKKLVIELDDMTQKADQVAALSPLEFLVSPEDIHAFLDLVPSGNPFQGDWYVTARYGADRGHSGNPRLGHRGNDIVVMGQNKGIYPTSSGIVVDIGIDKWLGKYVVVEHNPQVRTVYAHMDIIYYSALPGETVTPETKMGLMGSTGFADGAHLHYEIQIFDGEVWRTVDSYPYLKHPSE